MRLKLEISPDLVSKFEGMLTKQLGLDGKAIQTEMMSGDYEHLVNTFDKHFGHLVTLYR